MGKTLYKSSIRLGTALVWTFLATLLHAQAPARFITNMEAGKTQTVVAYGTSLTASGAWVQQVQQALDKRFPGLLTMINSGQGSMWSKWGVDNLETRVLEKHPDAVFIEFAINDAFLEYKTSVEQAQSNLDDMINRILVGNPNAEIFLMTMDTPIGIHSEQRPRLAEYYQMYRDVAHARNLKLIDINPAWQKILATDKSLFSKYVPDGIHPGPDGCQNVTTPAILGGLNLPTVSR